MHQPVLVAKVTPAEQLPDLLRRIELCFMSRLQGQAPVTLDYISQAIL